LESHHPERIKVAIETLWEDSKMRVDKMRENIALEQHLLGGNLPKNPKGLSTSGVNICEEESPVDEIYDGILIRSKRVPALLDLVLYGSDLNLPFQEPIQIVDTDVPFFLFLLIPKIGKPTIPPSIKRFIDYSQAFNFLIPHELLPKFLRIKNSKKSKKKY
jgi:hypothetical protein